METTVTCNNISILNRLRLLLHRWYPGRRKPIASGATERYTIHSAARELLQEFSGLNFGSASSERVEISLPVEDVEEIVKAINELSSLLGENLAPIAVIHYQDVEYLLVGESGEIFTLAMNYGNLGYVDAELTPLAPSFNSLLTSYLLRLPQKANYELLREEQKRCRHFGGVWKLEPWRRRGGTDELL